MHGLVVSFALHFLKKKTITVASLANLIKMRLHALNGATTFNLTIVRIMAVSIMKTSEYHNNGLVSFALWPIMLDPLC